MNHKFSPSQFDSTKCATCKLSFLQHTDFAECECCHVTGPVEIYKVADIQLVICPECTEKERNHQSTEKQEQRLKEAEELRAQTSPGVLNAANIIDRARSIDYGIQIKSDVFNAETLSLQEVREGIEADDTIPEKQFAYGKYVQERIENFQKVIFEKQSEIMDMQNRQRVLQSELNTIVSRMREEERTRLKQLSPNYAPAKVKAPSKPRNTTPKIKFDKKGCMEVAQQLQSEGHPVLWHMVQQTCVQRNMTPQQAAIVMREIFSKQQEVK